MVRRVGHCIEPGCKRVGALLDGSCDSHALRPLPVARIVRLGPRLRRYIALGAIRQALAANLYGAVAIIMREGADAYGP